MEIEYLKKFQKLCKPKKEQKGIDAIMHRFQARHDMCREYAFAIPTKEAIKEISKYSPIVEIGAGSGYWAYLLNKQGAKVLAYDKYPQNNKYNFTKRYTQVLTGDEKILTSLDPSYNLLLCWPNFDNDFAYNSLKLFKGNVLIYIGEGDGGCTGNDKFHDLLNKKWNLHKELEIPQWDGIHDKVMIYTKK